MHWFQCIPLLFFLHLSTCSPTSPGVSEAPREVAIGSMRWMASDLDVVAYRNGDPVRHAKTESEWHDAARRMEGAWCWQGGNPHSGHRLYNWYALSDPRGLAPSGWHVPTDAEWCRLCDVLGGELVAGGALKGQGFAKPGRSGFGAVPAGSRNCVGGFYAEGRSAFFWTLDACGEFDAWEREVSAGSERLRKVAVGKSLGLSVRCLRD